MRKEGKEHEVILMSDMNECINKKGDLQDFFLENDLIDTVGILNPTQTDDMTYLYSTKRIDYIFIISTLSTIAVKVGHH